MQTNKRLISSAGINANQSTLLLDPGLKDSSDTVESQTNTGTTVGLKYKGLGKDVGQVIEGWDMADGDFSFLH